MAVSAPVSQKIAPTVQKPSKRGSRGLKRPYEFDSGLLDEAIAASQYTLEEFAISIEIDPSTLWRARNGKKISWKIAGDLCSALNRSPDDLRAKPARSKYEPEVPFRSPADIESSHAAVRDVTPLLRGHTEFLALFTQDKGVSPELLRDILVIAGKTMPNAALDEIDAVLYARAMAVLKKPGARERIENDRSLKVFVELALNLTQDHELLFDREGRFTYMSRPYNPTPDRWGRYAGRSVAGWR